MKYKLTISFDGTNYHGWQKQKNALSVQEIIEQKLEILLGKKTETIGCGRTDTGVHANKFVLHFETSLPLKNTFLYNLNSLLPEDIALLKYSRVNNNFNSRFSAKKREYRYFIHFSKDPFMINKSTYLKNKPDINIMNHACGELIKYTNFESFNKKGSDNKTTICKIYNAKWVTKKSQYIFIIVADRFLRNMVRAIVGTMLDVGFSKISLEQFKKIIESKNRKNSSTSAPAKGLYLWNIKY
ncbi:MAG: tRNA pseudouridine(38-40) synthase TruA [Bacteroidia bacterium]|nr:tRNA pseudouridine(38-40) synthase TruA [Bacteroidia bacterium]